MDIPVNEWKPSNDLVLETSTLDAITNIDNSLVIAGPGAGKTELLAQKACFLLETDSCVNPTKILAISFKSDAAANLKNRVESILPLKLKGRFISQTFDSFAKKILDRFLYALPDEFRPNPNYTITTNNQEIVEAFSQIGVMFSNQDSKKNAFNNLTNRKLENLSDGYKDIWNILLKGNRNINPTLNFPMISRLAVYILENNPMILKSLRLTYTYVFLDEFQDTTNLQYELIKTCFHNTETSLTAVGDTRQRIMLWAGAKKNVFETYTEEFSAEKYTLYMNHRSAPKLLEIQKIVNNYIEGKQLPLIPNKKWKGDEGIAEIWYFKNSRDEAEYIASKIIKLMETIEISHRDICIIVKQEVQKFTDELICEFKSVGIEARNEANYQDLLKEDIVILTLNTLKSALNVRDSDAWSFIWDIKIIFEGHSGVINPQLTNEIRSQFKRKLNGWRKGLENIDSKEGLIKILINIIDYYGIEKIINNYPQYSQIKYLKEVFYKTAKYLYQYYVLGKGWQYAIDSFEGKYSIPVMTVHKSKGLEFETVFFVGLDDQTFWNYSNQETEDTSTFFVGLSRAKHFLYFTHSTRRFGSERSKSNIANLYKMLNESGVVEEKYLNL